MKQDVRPAWRLIALLTIVTVVTHVVAALVTPCEFHRDEFLYMAMGRNLRLFAMDFPPMIALLSELQRALFGDALWSLRLAPALAHGALVLLTALLAAHFGGGRFAQLLGMLAVLTGPLFLRAGSLFQPVVFDQLWWTLALYALVLLGSSESTDADHQPDDARPGAHDGSGEEFRHWILFGVACGLGLLTKFSILIFGVGVLVALLISRRRALATRGPWLAVLIVIVLGAPSWLGQINLGMPVLAQMGDLRASQLERIGYGEFLIELIMMHGPAAFALASTGVFALVASRRFARWRVAGWACLGAFAIIMALRGKPYYTGPIFPTLFAAGAVMLSIALARIERRTFRRALQATTVLLVCFWGMAGLPLALPVFSPQATAQFANDVGLTSAVTTNQGVVLELPQDYADMLGWERKVARIADVYHALPAHERPQAVIITSNYGQAGAVDFYGPRFGLPEAEAPIGSYWFWGPGEKPGNVIVKVGGDEADLADYCGSITLATRIEEPWVVPEEQNLAVWICREPFATLQQIWPSFEGQN